MCLFLHFPACAYISVCFKTKMGTCLSQVRFPGKRTVAGNKLAQRRFVRGVGEREREGTVQIEEAHLGALTPAASAPRGMLWLQMTLQSSTELRQREQAFILMHTSVRHWRQAVLGGGVSAAQRSSTQAIPRELASGRKKSFIPQEPLGSTSQLPQYSFTFCFVNLFFRYGNPLPDHSTIHHFSPFSWFFCRAS